MQNNFRHLTYENSEECVRDITEPDVIKMIVNLLLRLPSFGWARCILDEFDHNIFILDLRNGLHRHRGGSGALEYISLWGIVHRTL